jgi:hypothetical protein
MAPILAHVACTASLKSCGYRGPLLVCGRLLHILCWMVEYVEGGGVCHADANIMAHGVLMAFTISRPCLIIDAAFGCIRGISPHLSIDVVLMVMASHRQARGTVD